MKDLIMETLLRLILILAIIGCVKDVIHFVECNFKTPYKAEALYGIGIMIPPVGAVIGYINIKNN